MVWVANKVREDMTDTKETQYTSATRVEYSLQGKEWNAIVELVHVCPQENRVYAHKVTYKYFCWTCFTTTWLATSKMTKFSLSYLILYDITLVFNWYFINIILFECFGIGLLHV